MGKCFLCGKLPDSQNNLTLHKFPRDENLCKKWLNILGLEKKQLTKNSHLCSNHFNPENFTINCNGSRNMLKPGSTPLALTEEVKQNFTDISREAIDQLNHILQDVDEKVLDSSVCLEKVPEPSLNIICHNETLKRQKALVLSTSKKMHEEDYICHDRHYTNTFQSMAITIAKLTEKLDSLKRENKILRQQTSRLKKKIIYQHSPSKDVEFNEIQWNNILKFDHNS
ncbi:THAP domain-containing protein 1-like isoform X2 [Leptopilina boulardi]|uniref:THAP domain-containing protein 1-like isoform X2 n=1 Tax=Leptopilina boulardi TaxID=63433 RepID=UPI0021F5250E|nr:THAP domain-containing protein 1-like isoform X2 [Leptopilina boulardi]